MSNDETKNNNRTNDKGSGPTRTFNDDRKKSIGQIGPYRLLSILGEGGFSIVYLAEQDKPVRRRVALKVIKPGMDTRQVIARFEAERQALALLDHPNIAPVYDAGTTENGLPYFVLENVKGEPITEHCDRQKLSIEDRLRLFLQVCDAVQYAHQKGIIHRDIKPSNILVSIQGERAAPKIIDFGVAKAVTQPLTDRTLFTEQGQFVGTPEYMSPEQAEMGAQDIDTRSDVYSLGVLLYELLSGTLPFESQTLREGGIDNIRKIIREQEPKRPSTRLTSMGQEAQKIAESRRTDVINLSKRLTKELEWIPLMAMRKDRTRRYRSASELADDIRKIIREQEPKKPSTRLTSLGQEAQKIAESRRTDIVNLSKRLTKELEWIPLMAMRKDRTRRYRSASELADDIRNYLQGKPLIAGPESSIYRLRKFVRRNQTLVLGVAAVMLVLIAGIIVSTVFAFKAAQAQHKERLARSEAERQMKISKAVSDFLRNNLLASADPYVTGGEVTIRSVLDAASSKLEGKFQQDPLVKASISHTLGVTYRNIGDFGPAEKLLERAYKIRLEQLGQDNKETLSTMEALARLYWRQARYEQAEVLFNKTIEGQKRVLGPEDPNTLYSMDGLAVLYFSEGRYQDARSLYEDLLKISQKVLGEEDVTTILFRGNLATVYRFQGLYQRAEELYLKAIEQDERVLGKEHPDTLYSMNGLGMLYIAEHRYTEAEGELLEAYEFEKIILGPDHLDTLSSMNGLGMVYTAQGRFDDANDILSSAWEIGRTVIGDDKPTTLTSMNCLAQLYKEMGHYEESESMFLNTLEGRQYILGKEHPDTLETMHDLAMLYKTTGRYNEAETLLLETIESRRKVLGETHPDTLKSINALIELYEIWGKPEQAQQWKQKLPPTLDLVK